MAVSIFDLFTIGIGPSSSHTVGPMRAARQFVEDLNSHNTISQTSRVSVELFGALSLTGLGHGTDMAVLMGLQGERPSQIDVDSIPAKLERIRGQKVLKLNGSMDIAYDAKRDLIFHGGQELPFHPNGMRFTAYDAGGDVILRRAYYSVGGGFVVDEKQAGQNSIILDETPLPHSFSSGAELLNLCNATGKSISDIMLENEKAWRGEDAIRTKLLGIWDAMQSCIRRGCEVEGTLPGLKVRRRAASMRKSLSDRPEAGLSDPLTVMDWISLYALAVNEENAAGGRVVTAPTNGAAGIVPAVLQYFDRFSGRSTSENITRFLLTAGAVGILFKENASISGAEVGCQGEVGAACSMAAAGLTEVMGGTPEQVENAAEIAMEHNLGLTCDPVGGLVQVPCIERNAMGAVKAINASRLALRGDGQHFVSLDKVIETMRETGRDMQSKYKETALGGLAESLGASVNIPEC